MVAGRRIHTGPWGRSATGILAIDRAGMTWTPLWFFRRLVPPLYVPWREVESVRISRALGFGEAILTTRGGDYIPLHTPRLKRLKEALSAGGLDFHTRSSWPGIEFGVRPGVTIEWTPEGPRAVR